MMHEALSQFCLTSQQVRHYLPAGKASCGRIVSSDRIISRIKELVKWDEPQFILTEFTVM